MNTFALIAGEILIRRITAARSVDPSWVGRNPIWHGLMNWKACQRFWTMTGENGKWKVKKINCLEIELIGIMSSRDLEFHDIDS